MQSLTKPPGGQYSIGTINASRQSVHAQNALLNRGFDRYKAHVWSGCRFVEGGCIVGIILTALALQSAGRATRCAAMICV